MGRFLPEGCRRQESCSIFKGGLHFQREVLLNELKAEGTLFTGKWGFYWPNWKAVGEVEEWTGEMNAEESHSLGNGICVVPCIAS